jgi:glycosyltransferase involved in cell wall biosynthesis
LPFRGQREFILPFTLNKAAYLDRLAKGIKLTNLTVNQPRYSLLALARHLKKTKAENIFVFNSELAVITVLIKIYYLRHLRIVARNINALSFKQKRAEGLWRKYIVIALIKRYYPRVSHIINQCAAMEGDLLSVLPELEGRTSHIYNPLNVVVEKAQRDLDFSTIEREDYLLCVGRLTGQKAFHYAIQGFAAISATFPGLKLKFLGQGELEEELREVANNLGVGERVEFVGFQKNMIPFYAKARATVLTSLHEGFPNVLLESIALGTPVVAFDCPSGPSEIIINGQNGYLVAYLDEEDLVQKLIKTLNETWNHTEVQKTAKKFSSKEIIHQYDELLTKLFFSN